VNINSPEVPVEYSSDNYLALLKENCTVVETNGADPSPRDFPWDQKMRHFHSVTAMYSQPVE
jgi:hypothetical protein